MAIITRYRRFISPPPSPSPRRQSPTSDLAEFLQPSNAHLRTPLPRTDSENRREELAKRLARDEELVLTGSSGEASEDASYVLAKAVVGRYMERYLPGIKKHRVVLERGVEVVGESLRQMRRGGSGGERRGEYTLGSLLSSLVHRVEVEWMVWSRMAPPAVALYSWWVAFAIWRKLDDGERDLVAQLTTNREKVETWLKWAFAGLAAMLCVLALVVWAVVAVVRVFWGSKLDPPPRESDKST